MEIDTKISIEKLNRHLIDVEIKFSSPYDRPLLEIPLWTPGSYLIREFARHVQNFEVFDENNNAIKNQKTTKNSWQIEATQFQKLTVRYSVFAFELTVRTSYLDNRQCLINPANVCMYIVNEARSENTKDQNIKLSFKYPKNWTLFTSLQKSGNFYLAKNFDELVDSPVAIASDEVTQSHNYVFENNDVKIPNSVVFIGDKSNENLIKFSKDLMLLQENSIAMFGRLPYDRYLWLVFITENKGGGLEHKYSNTSITSRYSFKDPKKYAKLLSLEAHEHFHTYNIKRIRPSQLGPFEYSSEVYTKLLWVAEGLTSFYDNIILPRSNLISKEEYWSILCDDLQKYFELPGRFVDSLESSSFDAWIKLYRPNMNSVNNTVSYYLKGGIVGFMLDLEIRLQTDWKFSLDTFFKKMYEDYLEDSTAGYKENEIKQLFELTTNTNLDTFWLKYISGTEELDLDPYLSLIGMQMTREPSNDVPYTGIKFGPISTKVKSIYTNSPAEESGIYPQDQVVAVNGFKVTISTFDEIMKNFEINENISFHLFRDGKLMTTNLIIKEPLNDKFTISEMDSITNEQRKRQNEFFYQ